MATGPEAGTIKSVAQVFPGLAGLMGSLTRNVGVLGEDEINPVGSAYTSQGGFVRSPVGCFGARPSLGLPLRK